LMDLETKRSKVLNARQFTTLRGSREVKYCTFNGSPGRLAEFFFRIDPRNLKHFLSR
jgi:hypothetical protein